MRGSLTRFGIDLQRMDAEDDAARRERFETPSQPLADRRRARYIDLLDATVGPIDDTWREIMRVRAIREVSR
jgi:hypothetical protein